jgi:hypothetical protein
MTDTDALTSAFRFAQGKGAARIALCYHDRCPFDRETLDALRPLGLVALIRGTGKPDSQAQAISPVPVVGPRHVEGIDTVVIGDAEWYDWCYRELEPVSLRGVPVVPAHPGRFVPDRLRTTDKWTLAKEWVPADYVSRSALRGHYAEFGTFFGKSFFSNYHRLAGFLRGSFYAFDSFAGLSQPLADETRFTDNDFKPGAYACNLPSFLANAELTGADTKRIRCVSGFYADSLVGHDPAEYGLAPQSISVCVIDCDLLEPTRQVLDFIQPLLEPGALLYFDDWRLCRASPKVGERAAALAWLRDNPSIDLVELHRDYWQHQWFIFHP